MRIRAARTRQPVPEAFIDADVLRIPVGPGAMHVERYGHGGRPILLIHGFGTSSFLWREVAPALALAHHTAFAVDLFGYGESDRPFDADFGIAAQADYLDRALTALRVSRATIVGVDLGGAVALRLVAARTERVERLVLVNTPALDDLPGGDIRGLQRNTARFVLRLTRGILGVSALLTPLLRQSVADPAHMPDRLVARYLAPYVGEDGIKHLLALARSVRAQDLHDVELESIQVPTLLVWGEEDHFVDDRLPERLATRIPGCRLLRLPHVGRLVPEDAPDRFVELLLEFIRETA